MSYSSAQNRASIKYVKEHQKQILLRVKKEEYETVIEPAIKKSGLPAATYIKQAIYEKIERDKMNDRKSDT